MVVDCMQCGNPVAEAAAMPSYGNDGGFVGYLCAKCVAVLSGSVAAPPPVGLPAPSPVTAAWRAGQRRPLDVVITTLDAAIDNAETLARCMRAARRELLDVRDTLPV